jgi:hypothetical protein
VIDLSFTIHWNPFFLSSQTPKESHHSHKAKVELVVVWLLSANIDPSTRGNDDKVKNDKIIWVNHSKQNSNGKRRERERNRRDVRKPTTRRGMEKQRKQYVQHGIDRHVRWALAISVVYLCPNPQGMVPTGSAERKSIRRNANVAYAAFMPRQLTDDGTLQDIPAVASIIIISGE